MLLHYKLLLLFFQFCSKGAQFLQKVYSLAVTYLGLLIQHESSIHALLTCVLSGIAHGMFSGYVQFLCIYLFNDVFFFLFVFVFCDFEQRLSQLQLQHSLLK